MPARKVVERMTVEKVYGIDWNDRYGAFAFTHAYVVAEIAERLLKDEKAELYLNNRMGHIVVSETKNDRTFADIKVVRADSCDLTDEEIEQLDFPVLKIAMPKGLFRMYYPLAMKTDMPWEHRPWYEGYSDCYRLALEYYHKVLGIKVRAIITPEKYTSQALTYARTNLFLQNFASCGFEQVMFPEAGDVMLMKAGVGFNDGPDHIAIYLGDDKMLHHNRECLSVIQPYTPKWRLKTVMVLRHTSKMR